MNTRRAWLFSSAMALCACGQAPAADTEAAREPEVAATTQATGALPAEAPGHGDSPEPAAPRVDGHSLQNLDPELSLVDQRGQAFALASLAGKPTLLTFFYTSCTTMCPLIITDVKRIVAAIPEAERQELQVVLISIDPAHDTVARLRTVQTDRAMPENWRLVTGDEASIRTVASTVGAAYRRLPDGSFAHSALYTALDAQGHIQLQVQGTGRPIEELVAELRRLLSGTAPR